MGKRFQNPSNLLLGPSPFVSSKEHCDKNEITHSRINSKKHFVRSTTPDHSATKSATKHFDQQVDTTICSSSKSWYTPVPWTVERERAVTYSTNTCACTQPLEDLPRRHHLVFTVQNFGPISFGSLGDRDWKSKQNWCASKLQRTNSLKKVEQWEFVFLLLSKYPGDKIRWCY